MKTTAILLTALLMAALLVSCAGSMGTGTTTASSGVTTTASERVSTASGGTSAGTSGTAKATSGTVGSSAAQSGGTSGSTAGSGMLGAASSAISSLVSGIGQNGGANPEDARIMFNNTLYKGSREELRTDELGRELSAVTIVEKTPDANGEASGVEADSKLYAIKNVNDYSAIAFECGGVYYRAEKQSA